MSNIQQLFNGAIGGLFGRNYGLTDEEIKTISKIQRSTNMEFLEELKDEADHLFARMEELEKLGSENEVNLIAQALDHYRKYTDKRGVQDVIDDWIDLKCSFAASSVGGPFSYDAYKAEEMRYLPEKYNKTIPKNGGWIMVTTVLPVAEEHQPIPYSVYFAKPAPIPTTVNLEDSVLGLTVKAHTVKLNYYKVRIQTETGEVHLWPHEYIRITHIEDVLSEVGNSFEMVRMGGDANYDAAKVHYLSTRGISQEGVYRLLLNSVNSMNHVFFKIIEGKPREFWAFYIDALNKRLDPDMAVKLWQHQESGIPMFNIEYSIDGEKVTEEEFMKNSMVEEMMESEEDGTSLSQKMEELTVKQEQDENTDTVSDGREEEDPKTTLPKAVRRGDRRPRKKR